MIFFNHYMDLSIIEVVSFKFVYSKYFLQLNRKGTAKSNKDDSRNEKPQLRPTTQGPETHQPCTNRLRRPLIELFK